MRRVARRSSSANRYFPLFVGETSSRRLAIFDQDRSFVQVTGSGNGTIENARDDGYRLDETRKDQRMKPRILSVLAAALTIILITSLLPESLIAAKPEVAQLTAVIHHLEQVRRKIDTELTYDRELLHKETHR